MIIFQGEDGLELGGRKLLVSLAVPRAEASKLREVKKDQQKVLKKDKRNTYLLQEGCKLSGKCLG